MINQVEGFAEIKEKCSYYVAVVNTLLPFIIKFD